MCLADDMALNDSNKRVFRLAFTMSGLLGMIGANANYRHCAVFLQALD